MARRIIPVSFKKEEINLYKEVFKHSDHSSFIKGCIQYWIDGHSNSNDNKSSTQFSAEPIGISNDILNL